MKRFGLLGSSALCSAAFIGASLTVATPAYAQDADADCSALPTQAERDACEAEEASPADAGGTTTTPEGVTINVTGSRLARPTLESPVPVTSVSATDLLQSGTINMGDALNDLPQLRSTFSQANSTRFIGTSGLNVLDLRGLGTARTLVLVNGRRHITASPGDYLVDVNTIPDDLLERVDVVTGGSSAVYGSDAVAGVVNFVLKRDFDGIRLSGQAGVSALGDRGSYFAALTAGRNFAEGRGNIAASFEFSRANDLYFVDRESQTGALNGPCAFTTAENTSDDTGPSGSDGIPDTQYLCGLRNNSISNGGMVTSLCNAIAVLGDPRRCVPGSTATFALSQRYMFLPDGNLVLNQPGVDLRTITAGLNGSTVGGLGSTVNERGQLVPKLERFSGNLLAHFDISEALSPYVEAKFVRIKANQEGQPSFFQGIPGFFGGGRDISCSNPFLTTQNIAVLQAAGRCGGAVYNPNATISLNRFNIDFGGRGELHTRDTYRIVGGIEGTFNDDWHYDISANYGVLETDLTSTNNLLLFDLDGNETGFLNAVDAVRNAGGQIVCRVNADADPSNDDPACVPINVFGYGRPSQAALDYVNTTATREEKATELDILATLRGDTSGAIELPGGPIRFSIGAEYRKETARSEWDELTAFGGTFLNAIQPFLPPDLTVKEAFAEVEIPLLKDMPFADELTLSGALRVSDYNSGAGTVWTYNAAAYYAPVHDVRFRANYARAVRAPTQSDLYSTPSQNFGFVQDPCDVGFINAGGQVRRDNCAAAGIPVGFINQDARDRTISFLSGGNENLDVEKSKSLTLGVILEPRWVRGLSLTVDYYKIEVENLIAVLSAQTIINSCYDNIGGLDNPFCDRVFRDADFTFSDVATISEPINFQRQETAGVDADLAWNRTFGNGDRLSLRGIFSYVFERTNYTSPTDPDFGNRQLSELGDPQIEFQISAAYRKGPVNFRYQLQYIGQQTIGTYEQQHSFQGRPPTNLDAFPQIYYPSVTYHNTRIGWNLNSKFEFYIGVDNLFNRLPPLGLTGAGAGSAIFDNIGRYFYGGFKANF